jgi:hypothetical protein
MSNQFSIRVMGARNSPLIISQPSLTETTKVEDLFTIVGEKTGFDPSSLKLVFATK